MIKRTSIGHSDILSVRVIDELNTDDIDWLSTLISNKANDDEVKNILLFIEFEDFENMTIENLIKYFTLFLTKGHSLMQKVKRAVAITDDKLLASKLTIEFGLLPSTKFKSFKPKNQSEAVQWLTSGELPEPA